MRVIVVEDDRMVRHAILAWLERQGHEVHLFGDAERFCRHAGPCDCAHGEHCTDILICDVRLPGRTGLELAADLRGKACRIPHIGLISGWWTDASVARAQDLNVRVFKKPLDMGHILTWVQECSRTVDSERRLAERFHQQPAQAE